MKTQTFSLFFVMYLNNDTTIVYGPPGTGKTTYLINIIRKLLSSGVIPEDICFLTFTRKAAQEAQMRVMSEFNIGELRIPYFRTIHSLCYRMLGIKAEQIISTKDLVRIAKATKLFFTLKSNYNITEQTSENATVGDKIRFIENLARVTGKDILEVAKMNTVEQVPIPALLNYEKTYQKFKEDEKKIDFTDMLVQYLTEGFIPPVKHLIVDEAQDLSGIQWRVIEKIAKPCEKVWVAGDDDQAIFNWAGADVHTFLNIEGKKEYLNKSYRLPSTIHKRAVEVAGRIRVREPKEYLPVEEGGQITRIPSLTALTGLNEGSWLFLARNVFLLDEMAEFLYKKGYIYETRGNSPINLSLVRAVKTWERLRSGETVLMKDVKELYEHIGVGKGFRRGFKKILQEQSDIEPIGYGRLQSFFGLLLQREKPWYDVIKFTGNDLVYLHTAFRNGESMSDSIRFQVNTIHGVKGGEADNVVLMTDMAGVTMGAFERSPDPEHRVWYVAITRARKNLFILNPTTNYSYNL